MTTRDDVAVALVAELAGNAGVRDGIVAQASTENTTAAWNPLATTMPWAGATKFNNAGVRNYLSEADGIAATAATLRNGLYPGALAAIAAGDAEAYVKAIAGEPWGTWHDEATALAMLEAVRNSPAYGATVVAGPAPAPTTTTEPPQTIPPPPPPPPAPPPAPDQGGLGFMLRTLEVVGNGPAWLSGGDVKTVQVILNAKASAGLAVDGVYGNMTAGAVRNWQARHGLTVDGIVGPQTWPTLIED